MKLPLKLNNDGIHYFPSKCYSYNMFMNIITGGRGIGKTTGFLVNSLQSWSKSNEQFIYLRRYKPEIKTFINSGTINNILPGCEFRGDGAGGSIITYSKKILGYCKILATAITSKSTSFPMVRTILFDEAFLVRGSNYRYLADEVTTLLNFVSTVFRERKGCRIIILGNNDDMFNPYLAYFKIPWFKDIYIDKDRGIYCEYAKPSEKLLAIEEQTELYKLTKGTQFGDYHYANALLTNVTGKLMEKPNGATIFFRFKLNDYILYIYKYTDKKLQKLWVSYEYYGEGFIDGGNNYVLLDNNNVNYYNIQILRNTSKTYFNYMYYNDNISFKDNTSIEAFGKLIELL